MSGANTFGNRLRLTTFGESHGTALGAVIDGVPAALAWDQTLLERDLARRRPGQSALVTSRGEQDAPEILSGVFENKTLGTPIAIIVRNHDQRSEDYKEMKSRPGHADDMWREKFGHSDPRGGGRSSGRETVSRVMGGAVAKMILGSAVKFTSFARAIGPYELAAGAEVTDPDSFAARFPTNQDDITKLLTDAKAKGHSYGGIAELWIDGLPLGLGQPVFHKLKADLAGAMMSVGATSGLEFGAGFAAAREEGSQFHSATQPAYGGVRGGISTGERLILRVAFKPTSSVLDVAKKGRHDPCIVPRAIPVLEAMAALVLADHVLWMKTDRA